MRSVIRLSLVAAGLITHSAVAADAPNPFAQKATPGATAGATADALEFAGVSTVGKKTMITLYDKEQKRNHWIEVGSSAGGITVVKYDAEKDHVTIRRDGAEKVLPLRAARAVISGPAPALPPPTPAGAAPTPLPTTPGTTGGVTTAPGQPLSPTGTTAATAAPAPGTPPPPMSQARQEEEARMLVSDLLEIGMAQRKAYEEAQRKAAQEKAGQPPAAQPPAK